MSFCYLINFHLTRKCTAECSYCDVWCTSKYSDGDVIKVDITYLKYVMEILPHNLIIILNGGEPGLVSNLDDVVNYLSTHEKVYKLTVLSNGLVRKINYGFLYDKNIRYNEHLVNYIDGLDIIKLHNLEFNFNQSNWKYVIIPIRDTVKSLLDNWDHYRNMGLFKDNVYYKFPVPKRAYDVDINLLTEFYHKLANTQSSSNVRSLELLKRIDHPSLYELDRGWCIQNPTELVIDFENNTIHHCSFVLHKSKSYTFNKINFERAANGYLFNILDCPHDCINFYNRTMKRTCYFKSVTGNHVNMCDKGGPSAFW